jgi:hypothetical protein
MESVEAKTAATVTISDMTTNRIVSYVCHVTLGNQGKYDIVVVTGSFARTLPV